MNTMKFTVETKTSEFKIDQGLYLEMFPDAREELIREVLDLREAHIRAALIALGWTPPKEEGK